ncbi:MAG: TonB-dependent receptor [Campylobacteraceae bacterium]|jgi:outer membrane receptor for ferrienterochelin and colicins|nr:TonB-dependent receptor [Campylobacteraceae bacterium]
MKSKFCLVSLLLGGALLALNAAEVEEVEAIKVVSATGYEQNIDDAPASVYVITKEELENKSYNDLSDALKNVPGVYVTGGSVFQDISIRGMANTYTLYMVDGKPLPANEAHGLNGGGGGVMLGGLPPISMIERIEVVRGPMSSLYGSEAMGGVINIITKKTPQEWSGSIKAEYTRSQSDITEDGYQWGANLAGPLIQDVLSLQLYGSTINIKESYCPGADNATSCGGDNTRMNPEFTNKQVGAKTTWAINNENSVWLSYDYSQQLRASNPGKSIPRIVQNRTTKQWSNNTRSENLANRQTVALGHDYKSKDFILNTYIQDAFTKNPSRGDGIDYGVLTANTQGTYFFETNTLTAGLQYKKETLDDRATNVMQSSNNGSAITQYNSYEVSKQQYAVFAEDEWSITDNLALTGGFRVNNYEGYGTHFTPRIYAVYGLTDNLVLKGGASGGYKVPSLRQSASDFGGVSGGGAFPPVVMAGNPDLKPESSMNYEIALSYSNQDVGFSASVTAYHTKFKDKIETYTVCDSNSSTALPFCNKESADFYGSNLPYLDIPGGPYSSGRFYHNIEGAKIEGIEVTFNYGLLSNLILGTSYTYTKSKRDDTGAPLNSISKHMVNTNLDFKATNKLDLWVQHNYRGKYDEATATTSVTNKGYSLVDIGAVYKFKDSLKFTAGLYNVANKEIAYDTHGKYIDGRRIIVGFNSDF